MKKILFRADAKPEIGIGDLASLINMSRYFERAGWQAHFIVKDNEAAKMLINREKIGHILFIDSGMTVKDEVEKINNYVGANRVDAVMLEITERKLTEYAGITDKAVIACVNFDGVINEQMKLIVNWDVNSDKLYDTKKYGTAKFLLGPQYVVLPLDFDFERINKRSYNTKPGTLLIAMGGADEFNLTQDVAAAVLSGNNGLAVRIVVGSGYRYYDSLKASIERSGNVTILWNVGNIFDEYMRCDAAIGAGGLTLFELVATRTPALIVAAYKHQIPRCEYFDKKGWIDYMGFRSFGSDSLLKRLAGPMKIPPPNIFKTDEIRKVLDEIVA